VGPDERHYSRRAASGKRPNPMRIRRRATIQDLRLAVNCLPRHTREAMLEGIRTNPIIVGAYTDPNGICPMLAAHRAGGRTNLIAFARAWDRFAFGGSRVTGPRPATARELLIGAPPTARLGSRRAERPGDQDRSRELRQRPGWAWTRIVRRYDEYQWALKQVQVAQQAPEEWLAREPDEARPTVPA
jgi:hypothetical protein